MNAAEFAADYSTDDRSSSGRRLGALGAAARPRDLATELRSAPRLEARPGPAATLRHRSHAARPEDHAQASDRAVHGAYLSAAVTPYGRYTSL